MAQELPPLLDCLAGLERAVAAIDNTWKPEDPLYLADIYRQTMMQFSYGYFAFFHATADYPDWSPLWNPVYTLQPNPDDIYLYSPVSAERRYRISGSRGTVKKLMINTQAILPGFPGEIDFTGTHYAEIDDADMIVGDDGSLEILVSSQRPQGHAGNWLELKPGAAALMMRFRSYDWLNEVDPRLSIECLDPVPPKPRLTPEDILERIRHMAAMPAMVTDLFFAMQNQVREAVGVNAFQPVPYGGSLQRQVYLPAVFEFEPGEALIIEAELPKRVAYWNFQLNDPYFNAVEYVYRQSSTNGHYAHISSDGKFRAVIALDDPGVPNWLDPAGYTEGTIYGRWYDADAWPLPVIKRVKASEVRAHLPADTPHVSAEERAAALRERVVACQRRRRW